MTQDASSDPAILLKFISNSSSFKMILKPTLAFQIPAHLQQVDQQQSITWKVLFRGI